MFQNLGDGTYLYRRLDGSLFRGTANRCRCLSSNTLIFTPYGETLIKDLRPGMLVFTLDSKGNRVVTPILEVSEVPVPKNYLVSHLILDDESELFVSHGHPTGDGRTIGDLIPGDIIDGARVVTTNEIPYHENFIYDILPSGETGFYCANSIILRSTLFTHLSNLE